eukprot:13781837-Ditylum_brightwellii.AAC.1
MLMRIYKGRIIPADVSDFDCNEVMMKDVHAYEILTKRGLKYHDEETNEDMIEFHVNSLANDIFLAKDDVNTFWREKKYMDVDVAKKAHFSEY